MARRIGPHGARPLHFFSSRRIRELGLLSHSLFRRRLRAALVDALLRPGRDETTEGAKPSEKYLATSARARHQVGARNFDPRSSNAQLPRGAPAQAPHLNGGAWMRPRASSRRPSTRSRSPKPADSPAGTAAARAAAGGAAGRRLAAAGGLGLEGQPRAGSPPRVGPITAEPPATPPARRRPHRSPAAPAPAPRRQAPRPAPRRRKRACASWGRRRCTTAARAGAGGGGGGGAEVQDEQNAAMSELRSRMLPVQRRRPLFDTSRASTASARRGSLTSTRPSSCSPTTSRGAPTTTSHRWWCRSRRGAQDLRVVHVPADTGGEAGVPVHTPQA